jgi:peptide-N4-(N-acetyl-beta-glucosaminyl)asparagine amidase
MVHIRRVYVLYFILVCVLLSASSAAGIDVLASRDLNLVGDAQMIGDWVRINHSAAYVTGAFWYNEQVAVQSGFVTQFRFEINEQGGAVHPTEGTDGADGLVFVIQSDSEDAIGGTGCNLGYDGIPNSIAIEFDTWWNGIDWGPPLEDPNGYHVSVHTRGTEPNSVHEEFSIGCVSFPELVTVDEHIAKVSYGSGLLEIYIDDLINPIMAITVDIAEILNLADGRAWLGFTGSTGSAWENHDILDWWIDGTPVPTTQLTWGRVKALYR